MEPARDVWNRRCNIECAGAFFSHLATVQRGKGVATSAGALFGLAPVAALVGVAIWAVTFWLTGYVSVASIAAAAALPLVILVTTRLSRTTGKLLFFSSVCLAAVVIWRHRSNLSRLMHGTEPRFNRK